MSQEQSPTQQGSDKMVLFCESFQHEKSSPKQPGEFLGCQDTGQSGQGPGRRENPEVKFPLWAEGPGFSGIISFSWSSNPYLMSISQVPGPDPKSLGGQCLPVTAKLPCLSQSSDTSLPSRGPGEQSGTSSTPLHLIQIPPSRSCCSSLPHSVRLGVFLLLWTPMGPPLFWRFSMSLSVRRYLLMGLFVGISFSTFLHVSLCITKYLPLIRFSPSPSGSFPLFMPFFQATHPHCFPLFFYVSFI